MRWFLRIVSIILLIAWMGFIFMLSNQTSEVSSQTSGGVIEFIAEKVYPDYENLTETEKQQVVASFQFIARKSAHVCVFAVLGFLAFLVFISYTRLRFFTRMFWATLISIGYAASDEYHQRFVAGRSCELRDFLLDIAGILAAILVCALFVKVISPLRRKTAFDSKSKKTLKSIKTELEDQLNSTVAQNVALESEIKEYKEKIQELEKEMECRRIEQDEPIMLVTVPVEEVAPMEKKEIKLDKEMEYASTVIGAVVVEVTKLCNTLAERQDASRKELINLALGRTEVLKAEILKILNKNVSFEEKKNLIENEKQETYDYFNSIIAQIC